MSSFELVRKGEWNQCGVIYPTCYHAEPPTSWNYAEILELYRWTEPGRDLLGMCPCEPVERL